MAALWLAAQLGWLNLPAEPWSARSWFFNPFGWQLIFFTGFAFASRLAPAPPVRRWLVWTAVAALLVSVPFAYYVIIRDVGFAGAAARRLAPLTDKTSFGALRYLHFLALAYLAFVAAGAGGARLRPAGAMRGSSR